MFMERPLDEQDAEECAGIFATLTEAVARCVESGALAPGEPAAIATEIWVLGHGIASLELAALLTHEQGESLARSALAHLSRGSARASRRSPSSRGRSGGRGRCTRPAHGSAAGRPPSPSGSPSPSARERCGPSEARRLRASCRAARPGAPGRRRALRRAFEREREPRPPPADRLADGSQTGVEREVVDQDPLAVGRHHGRRSRRGRIRSRAARLGGEAQPVVPVAAAHAVAARAAVDDRSSPPRPSSTSSPAPPLSSSPRSLPSSVSGPSPPRTRSNEASVSRVRPSAAMPTARSTVNPRCCRTVSVSLPSPPSSASSPPSPCSCRRPRRRTGGRCRRRRAALPRLAAGQKSSPVSPKSVPSPASVSLPAPPCACVLAVAVKRSSPSPSHATTPRYSGMPRRTTAHTTVVGDCWLQPEWAVEARRRAR